MDAVHADDHDALSRASAALDAGSLVIIPGDLHYLLVADALNDEAIERLFHATGRPADAPLTVCVAGYEDHQHVAFGTPLAHAIAQRDWPGPTTLILKPRPWVPEAILAGGANVAVNAPRHPFAQALARQFGPYACAPAAAYGAPAPLTMHEARAHAELAIDAGALPGGAPTLVDATGAEAKLMRAGGSGAP